jgi:hypothetical protein
MANRTALHEPVAWFDREACQAWPERQEIDEKSGRRIGLYLRDPWSCCELLKTRLGHWLLHSWTPGRLDDSHTYQRLSQAQAEGWLRICGYSFPPVESECALSAQAQPKKSKPEKARVPA